jgi:hypothetical protein
MSPGNHSRLTPLPDELSSPDEEQRRAFLAHFLQRAVPAERGRVIDRLLNVLGSGGEANRARAAASLADLGQAAKFLGRVTCCRRAVPTHAVALGAGMGWGKEAWLPVPLDALRGARPRE